VGLTIPRFTITERAAHWLTAAAFFSMLGSGVLVGRSGSFHNLMYAWHLGSAAALLAGLALLALGGDRRALSRTSRDLRRLNASDRRWLAAFPAVMLAGAPEPPAGRFNAGQKVNFLLISLLLAVLLASGIQTIVVGTHHNLIFGAHKLATIGAAVLVGGHLYMALLNPGTRPALRGMLTGRVDRGWARRHHPLWADDAETLDELDEDHLGRV
jgi:formate dehydrogenase subunit gamma